MAIGTYIDPGAGKVTLRVHSKEWLKTSHASEATKAKYKSLLDAQILPALGDVPVANMTPLKVKQFLARQSKKGYAPSTVRNLAEVLSALSHAAVDNGLLTQGWTPRRLDLPRAKADERVFLDHDQVRDLVANTPPIYRALVLTAAYTGLRWGELAGLRQNRLDLEQKRLEVVEAITYTKGVRFSPLKSGTSRRTVGLNESLVAALTEHLETFGVGLHQVVFHNRNRTVLRDDNFRKRVWLATVAKTESVPDGLRFHDLRHTHASLMILAGWDLKSVSARLGHSSVAITGDRYSHILGAVEERNLDALEAASRPEEGSEGDLDPFIRGDPKQRSHQKAL